MFSVTKGRATGNLQGLKGIRKRDVAGILGLEKGKAAGAGKGKAKAGRKAKKS